MKWEKKDINESGPYSYIRYEGEDVTAVIYYKRRRREIPIGKLWDVFKLLENDSIWQFPSPKEGHVIRRGYSYRIGKLLTELGYEDYTTHSLRHGAITKMVRDGHPPQKIADFVGHSTQTITDKYTHLEPDDLSDLVG